MKRIDISTPMYPNTFALVDDEDYVDVVDLVDDEHYLDYVGYIAYFYLLDIIDVVLFVTYYFVIVYQLLAMHNQAQ